MKAIVFLGPTLPAGSACQELDAIYCPPAAQGDVLRAVHREPDVIAIVDGQFDHVPAVWHKEILWAMSQGIHVYGSASMGALRAAELHAFGMVGIGRIFEWYRDGVLEDDDEVAVAHGPAQTGYRATSESMVNIRCALTAAEHATVISARTRSLLERVAKQRYFPERSYAAVLDGAAQLAPPSELARLSEWLGRHRIDQKRADALDMLRRIREETPALSVPKRVSFTFEQTLFWRHLVATAGMADETTGEPIPSDGVIEELWLEPETCVRVHSDALLRQILLDHPQEDVCVGHAELAEEESGRRLDHPLAGGSFPSWLDANQTTRADLSRLLRDERVLGRVFQRSSAYHHRLLDQLRLSGRFAGLAERARRKRAVLSEHGRLARGETDEQAQGEALLEWYLAHIDDADPQRALFLDLARASWREFVAALVRERDYQRLMGMGQIES